MSYSPSSHIVIIIDFAGKMVRAADMASQIHRRIEDGFYTNQTEHDDAVAALEEAEVKFQAAAEKLDGAIDIFSPFFA